MKITIDGKEIEARQGQSVLDAALDGGIFIPHLCSHPDLEAKGGCRLCSVEIEGGDQAVPACKTEAREGMKIMVNGAKAEKVRKTAMELGQSGALEKEIQKSCQQRQQPPDLPPVYQVCPLRKMYPRLSGAARRKGAGLY